MRETAIAWDFFEVVAPRAMPEKQHPDVKCRKCGMFMRNAQLGRVILPHAAYRCPNATTEMIDVGLRLIYQATRRKADRGCRISQTKLAMGEAGEPNWLKRQMRMHPWVNGYPSSDEEDEPRPPPKKKQKKTTKTTTTTKKTNASTPVAAKNTSTVLAAAQKTSKATTTSTAIATSPTTSEPDEPTFAFLDKAMAKESGAGLMVAEAFYQLGVPLNTLTNPTFCSILNFLNPKIKFPTLEELATILQSNTA